MFRINIAVAVASSMVAVVRFRQGRRQDFVVGGADFAIGGAERNLQVVSAVEPAIPDVHNLIALYVHLSTFHDFDPLVSTADSDFGFVFSGSAISQTKPRWSLGSDMGSEMVSGVFWRTQSASL